MPTKHHDDDGNPYWDREDPYPCMIWCGDPKTGRVYEELQLERRCSLPTVDPRDWLPCEPPSRFKMWLGAPQDYEAGVRRPGEDPEEGCPGGWARSRYARSMLKYLRRRVDGGGHDTNPLVHSGTSPHILEALRYYETCEAEAYAEYRRRINK